MVDASVRAELLSRASAPVPSGASALPPDEVGRLLAGLDGWELSDDRARLRKRLKPATFSDAIALLGRIARVADAEDHHPDVHVVSYNQVTIESWTHTVGGLTVNDFILAAKIDALLST